MRIHVTPKAGLSVRDPVHPHHGHLPPEGKWVEDSSAWRRLAAAGDVIIAAGDAVAPAKPKRS
jgi:hypothetical protein